jgi:predicted nucleotidyltransferase/HEPN domain-containing protein
MTGIVMKTGLHDLPQHKEAEILEIISLIREVVPAEMIILFGSYARGDWVEEKYDDEHYRYQSDYDILILVETKSEITQGKFEQDIEEKIEQNDTIKTPVSVIIHDIDFINRRLHKGQYFFADIKKEGILLYDSGKYELSAPKELKGEERKKLALEDFEYWFTNADEFLINFNTAFERGSYALAAFLLHQVTERLYSGILLVFTRYKPNTHDLIILRKLTNSVDSRLVKAFPFETAESRRLFKLLRKAYVDARYKPTYRITKDELKILSNQVEQLKAIGKLICDEKINSFVE